MEFLIVIVGVLAIFIIIQISNAADRKRHDKRIKESGFTITRYAGALKVDDKNKKWYINNADGCPIIYDFSEIIDCRIDEIGSLGGSITSLGVYIYTHNGGAIYTNLINYNTKKDSLVYRSQYDLAQQIYSLAMSIKTHSSEALPISVQPPVNSLSATNDADIEDVIYTKIVGVTHKNSQGESIQSILPTLNSGMKLELRREPNNPYDKNAIAVFCNGIGIGNLKADLAADLAPLMDKGRKVDAEIISITGGGDLSYGCNISVFVYENVKV